MRRLRLTATTLIALASTLTPASARAGIDACFETTQQFAMCSGFLGGIAGTLATAIPAVALARGDNFDGAGVAVGYGLGLYASVSGAALLASSQAQDDGAALKTSGTVLGVADLALGGLGMVLASALAVRIAIDERDGSGEDGEVAVVPWGQGGLGLQVTF